MDPQVILGFTGTKPNELTEFRQFISLSTSIVNWYPKHYGYFDDLVPWPEEAPGNYPKATSYPGTANYPGMDNL